MIPLLALTFAFGLFLLTEPMIMRSRGRLTDRLSLHPPAKPFLAFNDISVKFLSKKRRGSSQKATAVLTELPSVLEMLAVLMAAGDGIFSGLARMLPNTRGVLAKELKRAFSSLELGGDLESELAEIQRRLPESQVSEFTRKLALALRRGNPVVEMLIEQAESARAEVRNNLLRRAGRNETKMLIPLVFLILPITVWFAVYPSIQLLSITYQ